MTTTLAPQTEIPTTLQTELGASNSARESRRNGKIARLPKETITALHEARQTAAKLTSHETAPSEGASNQIKVNQA